MKLDIGGGKEPREGYTNVDGYVIGPDVINADAGDLPFPDNSIEAINSSHNLEHIEKRKVVPTLKEFYRVLQPGGVLEIEVPSLVWCCMNWLMHPDNGWNMDTIFGNQDDAGQFHYTGFTPEIMFDYLAQAGFTGSPIGSGYKWSHEQACLIFEVKKL